MNRIDRVFQRLKQDGEKALMPFLVAGDPDLATTAAILPAIERAGAAICELGIPFSDPIADGPVIQASMARALETGVQTNNVFEMIARLRPRLEMGLVAMVTFSIVHRFGVDGFMARAGEAGVDGLILPDLPLEETDAVLEAAGKAGLTLSLLIAPNTPDERAERIARSCTGFVYLLARAGLTGEQSEIATDLPTRIGRLRGVTDLPIAVGFGIGSAAQVRQVVQDAEADAAIVGSAIMRRVASTLQAGGTGEAAVQDIAKFVGELCTGLGETSAATGRAAKPE